MEYLKFFVPPKQKEKNSKNEIPGDRIQTGNLVYDPPRNGPTVWEIGIPDRTASEFYVPDPAPGLMTRLSIDETEK